MGRILSAICWLINTMAMSFLSFVNLLKASSMSDVGVLLSTTKKFLSPSLFTSPIPARINPVVESLIVNIHTRTSSAIKAMSERPLACWDDMVDCNGVQPSEQPTRRCTRGGHVVTAGQGYHRTSTRTKVSSGFLIRRGCTYTVRIDYGHYHISATQF